MLGDGRIDLNALVAGVRAEDPIATEDLYALINRCAKRWVFRELGNNSCYDGADCIEDVFIAVTQAIRRDDGLRCPDALIGYIRTFTRRTIFAEIGRRIHSRNHEVALDADDESNSAFSTCDYRHDPEQVYENNERDVFVGTVFEKLNVRDQEILRRFYVEEQSQCQIMLEMNLNETQFRLMKSRAKAKFGAIGKRLSEKKPAPVIDLKLAA